MSDAPDLSIVVCTRNRADLLDQAMESLVAQTASGRHDVWIVDNGSSDATPDRARAWAAAHPQVHAVREERVGLANARNAGFRASRGRWVAYVDDDARVPKDWAAVALGVIDERAPEIFGGPYRPFYREPKPGWFRDAYQSMRLGDAARALGDGEFFSGSCIAVRRDVLEALGGFDAALGMTGEALAYGEETALQLRIRREIVPAPCFWYEPALEVEHLVRAEKMTLGWILRSQLVAGRDAWLVLGRRGSAPSPWIEAPRIAALAAAHVLAFAARVGLAAVWRDRRRFPDLRNFVCERAARHVRALGALGARLRELRAP